MTRYDYLVIESHTRCIEREAGERVPSSSHETRGERILEAAAQLIVRWGYKKTTVDDIAREAGVAKGTIYLHWKTREELFKAVLVREELKLMDDLRQRIADDPEGTTLHGLMKHATFVTLERPIWKAVLTQDAEMLGELTQSEYATHASQETMKSFLIYYETLRGQGLIRSDLSVKQFVFMLTNITMGFLLSDPFIPDDFKLTNEEAAELLADTIKRTFASIAPVAPEQQQRLTQAFNQYVEHEVDALQQQQKNERETS